MKKLLALILILGLAIGIYGYKVNPASASCGNGFSYCRSLTINPAQVSGGPLSNFTWLACANGTMGNGSACQSVPGLNQTGAGNHVTNSNGYDVTFWLNSDCSGAINWEMEKYVASSGETEAYLKSASLDNGSVVEVCFGKSSISTFQGGATGTAWDPNYKGVYHLPDGSSLTANDSIGNNNGTNNGATATTGQIDGAAAFDGTSQNIDIGSQSQMFNGSNTVLTVSFWANVTDKTNAAKSVVLASDTVLASQLRVIYGTDGGTSNLVQLLFNNGTWPTNLSAVSGSINTITNGTWAYVSTTLDLGNSANNATYLNAVANGATNGTVGTPPVNYHTIGGNALIGKEANGGTPQYFGGSIDELRISNISRSANWVTTEYNNQSAPATFETFGAEQANTPVHAQVILIKSQIIINKGQEIIN